MKCQSCGVEKDPGVLEVYPWHWPEEPITDKPIKPFFTLDCEGEDDFRQVTVCHRCFHRLQPDMWIGRNCWEALTPAVPFNDLPRASP